MVSVSGRSLVPCPAASKKAFIVGIYSRRVYET
jgi:hypothetical protein